MFLVRGDSIDPVTPPAAIDVHEVEHVERALEDIEMLRQLDAPAPAESPAQKEVL